MVTNRVYFDELCNFSNLSFIFMTFFPHLNHSLRLTHSITNNLSLESCSAAVKLFVVTDLHLTSVKPTAHVGERIENVIVDSLLD